MVEWLLRDIKDLPVSEVVMVDFRDSEGCFLFHTVERKVFKYYISFGFMVEK